MEGGIARLTFDRPAARNAMTWRMYDELAAGLARIEADASIRVAVLRGAGGKAFIAGTDIQQFTAFTSGDDGIAYEERIETYVSGLERVRVPTIAVVEGLAVGGGLVIANACDLRVATPGARFGVPIARTLGNCLSPANLRRLTAALGVSMVKRMILLAEMPAAEVLMPWLGAISRLLPLRRASTPKWGGFARRSRTTRPVTMAVTRDMLRRLEIDPGAEADGLVRSCYGSDDFALGVRAFLSKSQASWTGR